MQFISLYGWNRPSGMGFRDHATFRRSLKDRPIETGNRNGKTLTKGGGYTVKGTKFNGCSQGAAYGNHTQSATSSPLVRSTRGGLTNNLPTKDFISIGRPNRESGVPTLN